MSNITAKNIELNKILNQKHEDIIQFQTMLIEKEKKIKNLSEYINKLKTQQKENINKQKSNTFLISDEENDINEEEEKIAEENKIKENINKKAEEEKIENKIEDEEEEEEEDDNDILKSTKKKVEKIIKNIDKYINQNKKQKLKNELKNINQQLNLIIKEKENDNKQIDQLKK